MKSNYIIWGAIVILAGAIMHSAGILASAISGKLNYGTSSTVFGSILMMIGFIGPGLGSFLKRSYDEADVDQKPKDDS